MLIQHIIRGLCYHLLSQEKKRSKREYSAATWSALVHGSAQLASKMLVLGLILVLLTSHGVKAFQCPDPCRCFPNFDAGRTITVDCRGQDLFEIPFPIPPETRSL